VFKTSITEENQVGDLIAQIQERVKRGGELPQTSKV
jgi:hypothetical protein